MSTQGYFDSADGYEIAVIIENKKLFGLQTLSWKESQSKTVRHAAGLTNRNDDTQRSTAIGIQRGVKEYTLDLEIMEVNKAIIEETVDAERDDVRELTQFTIGQQTVESILDLRDLTIVVRYPEIYGIRRKPTFLGVEFTDNEGGFSLDEVSDRKLSAIALDAKNLI